VCFGPFCRSSTKRRSGPSPWLAGRGRCWTGRDGCPARSKTTTVCVPSSRPRLRCSPRWPRIRSALCSPIRPRTAGSRTSGDLGPADSWTLQPRQLASRTSGRRSHLLVARRFVPTARLGRVGISRDRLRRLTDRTRPPGQRPSATPPSFARAKAAASDNCGPTPRADGHGRPEPPVHSAKLADLLLELPCSGQLSLGGSGCDASSRSARSAQACTSVAPRLNSEATIVSLLDVSLVDLTKVLMSLCDQYLDVVLPFSGF
jgi:hypothetical protein